MVRAYDKLGDYKKVLAYAKNIENHSDFKKSNTQFLYGKALAQLDQFSEAEIQLDQINRTYTNYEERLAFAKLLMDNEKKAKGMEILNELSAESKHIVKQNSRKYRATFTEVEKLLS